MDVSEMILASLSKIWHLVPIVIAIILFRKYITYRDKKQKMIKNEENEKNGLPLETRTKNKYEDLGYEIVNQDIEAQGIDLHMKRDDKSFLFIFDKNSETKSVKENNITNFIDDGLEYMRENNLDDKDVELRYVIQYSDVLHKSAINILGYNNFNCKYLVL